MKAILASAAVRRPMAWARAGKINSTRGARALSTIRPLIPTPNVECQTVGRPTMCHLTAKTVPPLTSSPVTVCRNTRHARQRRLERLYSTYDLRANDEGVFRHDAHAESQLQLYTS